MIETECCMTGGIKGENRGKWNIYSFNWCFQRIFILHCLFRSSVLWKQCCRFLFISLYTDLCNNNEKTIHLCHDTQIIMKSSWKNHTQNGNNAAWWPRWPPTKYTSHLWHIFFYTYVWSMPPTNKQPSRFDMEKKNHIWEMLSAQYWGRRDSMLYKQQQTICTTSVAKMHGSAKCASFKKQQQQQNVKRDEWQR